VEVVALGSYVERQPLLERGLKNHGDGNLRDLVPYHLLSLLYQLALLYVWLGFLLPVEQPALGYLPKRFL
jgi:hypothetical protein